MRPWESIIKCEYLEIFDLYLGWVRGYGDDDLVLEGEVEHEASYRKRKWTVVLYIRNSPTRNAMVRVDRRTSIAVSRGGERRHALVSEGLDDAV